MTTPKMKGDAMSRAYTATRPRGLCSWRPQQKTRALLGQVEVVLVEYHDHLPLTCRQVFYRLVGRYGYPKDELAYGRLLETLSRGRRAGLIPFESIRDDGVAQKNPGGFHGLPDFWEAVRCTAETYSRDLQDGQPYALEVWVEAAGMVPQVARVAHSYGIPVYSSGGFDSLTAKYEAARRAVVRPTVILSLGDHDPSGWSVFDAAAEDVSAMAADLGTPGAVTFQRVAVTPAQIARYRLPQAPAKSTDRRGDWQGGTVQCEALDPVDLAVEIGWAIRAYVDPEVLAEVKDQEEGERHTLLETLRELEPAAYTSDERRDPKKGEQ